MSEHAEKELYEKFMSSGDFLEIEQQKKAETPIITTYEVGGEQLTIEQMIERLAVQNVQETAPPPETGENNE